MFKFRDINNLDSVLVTSLNPNLQILTDSPDEVVYFSNGDKMTINLETGILVWEPIKPGEWNTSILSFRLHQWFVKGVIMEVKSPEGIC